MTRRKRAQEVVFLYSSHFQDVEKMLKITNIELVFCLLFCFNDYALCCCPCQQAFWKFSKVKINFLPIFDLKMIIFPLYDAKVSKFYIEYLILYILSNICKVISKRREGGSDKYEIWCVEQLGCAEKKSSKQHFCQTSPSWSKYLPYIFYHLYHETDIW